MSTPAAERPWPAPAKLNLMLRVLGRRADGYHRLQTAFQLLDYGDELRFSLRDDGHIRRSGGVPGLPQEDDLAVRAAKLLRRHTGAGQGIDIRISKRIPVGGGLGGGSSDAATALVATNRLWGTGLNRDELAALGSELGADVPVFVRGRSAWAEGIGNRLTALDLPPRWYLVIHPGVSVSTSSVFADPELTRNSAPITISRFLSGGGGNDCAPVVCARHEEVRRALEWLTRFGQAKLTGTGACVFAAFETEAQGRAVLERLPSAWTGFVARGLDRSPLLDMA